MSIWESDQTKPRILDVRLAAKTKVFEVQAVDLQFSNGTQRTYERLTPNRRPAVMVLPIHQNQLLMVREYAVGPERYEVCFPKGLIDEGESPEQAANRELQEEIKMAAQKLTPLRALYSSPSHMFGLMHVFIAEQLSPSSREGDEPEPLEIVSLPLTDIDHLLADPRFADAKSLAALFLLREHLRHHP